MCAVLSQFGYHTEAIENANKASVLSEDNILRTYHLYSLTEKNKKEDKSNKDISNNTEKEPQDDQKNNENFDENSEYYLEKMIQDEKINECELIMKALSILINKSKEFHKQKELSNLKNDKKSFSVTKITSKQE